MSSASSSSASKAVADSQSPHQERLLNFCRTQGIRAPNFQIISDRRGGRTAWSCVITMQNTTFPARFWYDGQYVNNAREDAAEKALQALGVVPAPAAQQTTQGRQQQQQ